MTNFFLGATVIKHTGRLVVLKSGQQSFVLAVPLIFILYQISAILQI